MGFIRDWISRIAADAVQKREQGRIFSVSEDYIDSVARRQYQVWEVENGWLLVDYHNRGNSPSAYPHSNERTAKYYPDLKALYEGMITARTQQALGLEKPSDQSAPVTSSWGAAGTAPQATATNSP